MAQGKPAERILNEVTRVGSTLAELATRELDVVLKDLSGPQGDTREGTEDDIDHSGVNVGTLAFNTLQLLSKVGDLVSQLSKYDLVRNDVPHLTLRSASPTTRFDVPADKPRDFEFLLGNDGVKDESFTITASLKGASGGEPIDVEIVPALQRILAGERHRLVLKLPKLPELGEFRLRVEIRDRSEPPKPIARKTVVVKVLASPRKHRP